nr:hypothetical protein [Tanacetum cinerariifolium]
MISTSSKMEGSKPLRLMETMDIMDLIPSIVNVHYITQDHTLSVSELPQKKETYANTCPEKRKLIDAEAKAVHMILNGIGNDIYSTVDAYPNAKEMWITIERLQQGESINI